MFRGRQTGLNLSAIPGQFEEGSQTMLDQPPMPAPKPRFMTPYVAIWIGLAALAALYLTALAVRPDIMAQYLPGSPPASEPASNEGQRAEADVLAEFQMLKSNMDKLQSDVSRLKTDVAAQANLSKAWETRIAALEKPPETKKVAKAPALKKVAVKPAPKPKASQTTKTAAAKPVVTPKTVTAPAKTSELKVINEPAAPKPKKLETGSVGDKPAVTFGPAVVSSTPKPVGVVIANGPSVDSLRLSWSLLSDRHAKSLGTMLPRYTAGIDEAGLNYELVAGPVSSAEEAKKLCKDLAANAVTCRVGEYIGQAL